MKGVIHLLAFPCLCLNVWDKVCLHTINSPLGYRFFQDIDDLVSLYQRPLLYLLFFLYCNIKTSRVPLKCILPPVSQIPTDSYNSADPTEPLHQIITCLAISPSEETLVASTDQAQLYYLTLSSADLARVCRLLSIL